MVGQYIYKTTVHVVVSKSGVTKGLVHNALAPLNSNIILHTQIDEGSIHKKLFASVLAHAEQVLSAELTELWLAYLCSKHEFNQTLKAA